MSWLLNSIANTLKLDESEDEDATDVIASASGEESHQASSPSDDDALRTGFKDDLSEFSKTLTRQLWGVASFLAPTPSDSQISDPNPQSLDPSESFDQDGSNSAGIEGIRSDFSEIGGRFRTGISKLSSNKAVSGFSKIASNFLQFVSEEGETLEDYAQRGVVGVTEEVVAFARDVSMHPQTWLHFPLRDGDDKEQDFEMSDIQQEHTFVVGRLAPTLAALRTELCPRDMSEGCFWKIYFVLVHPRLTKQDAEFLSTFQIVKARAMLTQESHTTKTIPDGPGRGIENPPSESSSSTNEEQQTVTLNDSPESLPANDAVVDKHTLKCTEVPVIQEDYIASNLSKGVDKEYDEDGDEWLPEELSEMGSSRVIDIPIEDGDVSFGDLEEEEEEGGEIQIEYKNVV